MQKHLAFVRIDLQTLAGGFFMLWLAMAVGCKTQPKCEETPPVCPPAAINTAIPLSAAPTDLLKPTDTQTPTPTPLPPTNNYSPNTNIPPQSASAPLVQVAFQNPVPQPLPEPALELTIAGVFEETLRNHPVLRVQKEEVQAAQARLITAGMRINPELVLDTDRDLSGDQTIDMSSRVMFTLEPGGKRRLRQAAASADISRAQWELKAETERILMEVADAAWEVLYLEELSRLEAKLREMAVKTAELQKSRADVSYADKIVADTDAAELELERLESKSALEIAGFKLSQAMGFDCPKPVRVRGELNVHPVKEMPTEELVCRLEKCRPQLCKTQAAMSQSQYLHSLECAKAKPDIGIGPRYRETFDRGVDRLGMRFTSEIPIFNRNQGGILESAAEMRKQCELYREARILTLTDAASAYKELLELQERVKYYRREIIPLAERTEATIHDAFSAGQITAEQMSNLQRNFVKLRLKELELRYRFNQLSTRLELFLGEPIIVPADATEPVSMPIPEPLPFAS
jgi:cobalt-zinc-cadmium efflux system outer membrane protein